MAHGRGPCFPQVMRGVLGLVRDHHVVIGVNYATLFVNASGARLARARSSARRLTDGMRACAPVRRDAGARTRWHGASAVPGIQRDRRRPAAAFAPPVPVFTQGCRGQVSARAAWTCVLPAARSHHAKEQAPYRQRTSKSIKAASASRWKGSGARSYEVTRRLHVWNLVWNLMCGAAARLQARHGSELTRPIHDPPRGGALTECPRTARARVRARGELIS